MHDGSVIVRVSAKHAPCLWRGQSLSLSVGTRLRGWYRISDYPAPPTHGSATQQRTTGMVKFNTEADSSKQQGFPPNNTRTLG